MGTTVVAHDENVLTQSGWQRSRYRLIPTPTAISSSPVTPAAASIAAASVAATASVTAATPSAIVTAAPASAVVSTAAVVSAPVVSAVVPARNRDKHVSVSAVPLGASRSTLSENARWRVV